MPEMGAEFPFCDQNLIREMIMDRMRNFLCPFSTRNICRKVNHDLEKGFIREVVDRINDIMLCCIIEFLFMEWRGIK